MSVNKLDMTTEVGRKMYAKIARKAGFHVRQTESKVDNITIYNFNKNHKPYKDVVFDNKTGHVTQTYDHIRSVFRNISHSVKDLFMRIDSVDTKKTIHLDKQKKLLTIESIETKKLK
jgi:hypothetical protein